MSLLWAAGFFDGEGYVGFVKHSSKKQREYMRLVMHIAQCDRRPLDRFCTVMGVGKVNGPYTPKTKKSRPYWVWSANSQEGVFTVRDLLYPHLCEPKQEQFDKAIACLIEWKREANARMGAAGVRRRKTHCPAGHEYSGDNLYIWKGTPHCRICRKAAQAKARGGN